MKIIVATSTAPSAEQAVADIIGQMPTAKSDPDFIAVHFSAVYDQAVIQNGLRNLAKGSFHGATSCQGVMSDTGMQSINGLGAGAFCIWDPEGAYGTAMRPIGDNARASARDATEAALRAAGRYGEAPDMVWLSTVPGTEEAVLEGVQSVLGRNVPILGGSAADNDVSGNWSVFDRDSCAENGVAVSVLFPSGDVSFAYHNGYAPTLHSGQVTKANGRRLIEIDNRPAADVYCGWTGGAVQPKTPTSESASILADSTLSPLGRHLRNVGTVPYFRLAHPSTLHPDGSLDLFADVSEGDVLTLMQGSVSSLTERAGKVTCLAGRVGGMSQDDVKGALVVYCGGCMMAVQDRMDDVVGGINNVLSGKPFMGIFSFGEQGMAFDGQNHHGNLMISSIVFS
ncbi:FIST signal transduction protein [Phaeobacter marinintestinus]|uniref:FIST signal transduction protein n=1 Tax=Falsiphaeobacter marinintestinus TaxID=1492905 RepID=UPI0011B7C94A|nr:FIST N-terminal domain-containing protein [Phaeobacter marinintestinus]